MILYMYVYICGARAGIARYHALRLLNLDVKFMKLLAQNGNSQAFVMNRKTHGDRKRLTCDLRLHVHKMQRHARHDPAPYKT